MSQLKVAKPIPLCKRYYFKNNKYIITHMPHYHVTKENELNKAYITLA